MALAEASNLKVSEQKSQAEGKSNSRVRARSEFPLSLTLALGRLGLPNSRGALSFQTLRSRSRSASFCYRAWDAGCRDVRQLSSCCRDIPRAPEESCFARRHRGSARGIAAERHVLSVAVLSVIELRRAAPSPRSSPVVPRPRRIPLRSAIPAHFPARNNRATFETHLAQCLAQVSPVVGQTVLKKERSRAGCLACVPGVGAPQFERCL